MTELAARLSEVRARIARAAERAGRDPSSIALVAVSKTHPASAVREAYSLGVRAFGENYVQELSAKARELADLSELRWHLIGSLQRNKVKQLPLPLTIEALGSARLADALATLPAILDVLVQVNVGREPQKSGCDPDELPSLLAHVRSLPSLRVRGLMTIPPFADDPEASRPCFRRLAALAREHGLTELSMGMSADLEVAVEEGATLVRVGTAIFGPRG